MAQKRVFITTVKDNDCSEVVLSDHHSHTSNIYNPISSSTGSRIISLTRMTSTGKDIGLSSSSSHGNINNNNSNQTHSTASAAVYIVNNNRSSSTTTTGGGGGGGTNIGNVNYSRSSSSTTGGGGTNRHNDLFYGHYNRLLDSDSPINDYNKASTSKIVYENLRYGSSTELIHHHHQHHDGIGGVVGTIATSGGGGGSVIHSPATSSSQHKNVKSLLSAAEQLQQQKQYRVSAPSISDKHHFSSNSMEYSSRHSPLQKFLGRPGELTDHLPKITSADDDEDDEDSSNTSSTLGAMEGPSSHVYHHHHSHHHSHHHGEHVSSHLRLSDQDALGDNLTFSRLDLEADCSENQEESGSISASKFDPYPYPPPEYKGRPRKHPYVPGKYPCHYCGWRCAKPSVLKKHIRSHTNERPYPCKYCNISFKTKSNLSKHEKSKGHMSMMNELKIQQNTASQATEDVALLCRRLEETEAHKGTFTRQDALLEALTRGSRGGGSDRVLTRGSTSPIRVQSSPLHQPLSPSRGGGGASSNLISSNVALSPYEYSIESNQISSSSKNVSGMRLPRGQPMSGILQYQDDSGVVRQIRVRVQVRENEDEGLDWSTIVQSDDVHCNNNLDINSIDITSDDTKHVVGTSPKHDYISHNGADDLYSPNELVEVDEAASEDIIHEEDVVCVNEVEVGLGGREHSTNRLDGCDSSRSHHHHHSHHHHDVLGEEDMDDESVYDVMNDDNNVNIFDTEETVMASTHSPTQPLPPSLTLTSSSHHHLHQQQHQKTNNSTVINDDKTSVTPSKQLRLSINDNHHPHHRVVTNDSPRNLRIYQNSPRNFLASPSNDLSLFPSDKASPVGCTTTPAASTLSTNAATSSNSPLKRVIGSTVGVQLASPNVNAYMMPQEVPVNLSASRSRNHFIIDTLKEEEEIIFSCQNKIAGHHQNRHSTTTATTSSSLSSSSDLLHPHLHSLHSHPHHHTSSSSSSPTNLLKQSHRGIPVDILNRIDRAITSRKTASNSNNNNNNNSSSSIVVKEENDDTLEEIVVVDDEDIPIEPDDEEVGSDSKPIHSVSTDRNESRSSLHQLSSSSGGVGSGGGGLQLRDDKAFCAHCDQWMDIGRMKTHLMTHKLAGDAELSYLNTNNDGKNVVVHSTDDNHHASVVLSSSSSCVSASTTAAGGGGGGSGGGAIVASSASSNLSHQLSRAGPRQYHCTVCNIGFRQIGHLNKHYRSKTHLTALCKAGHLTMDQMNQLDCIGSQPSWEKLIDLSTGNLNKIELKRLLSASAAAAVTCASSSIATASSSASSLKSTPTKVSPRNLRSSADSASPQKKK